MKNNLDRMIKAIIFDVDGVLLDSFEANLDFFQRLMAKNGYPSPTREEYAPCFHMHMVDTIRTITKSKDEKEINRIWEMGRSRETGYEVDLLKMPEGVEEVIKKLNKEYSLAIVTSRIKNGVYESPKMARLKKYFKVAVSYEDTEKHKPDPDPLQFAAEKLNVKPEECIYVGDLENDILAARAANMKIIIYSKHKLSGADACTSSFTKILELISSLNKN